MATVAKNVTGINPGLSGRVALLVLAVTVEVTVGGLRVVVTVVVRVAVELAVTVIVEFPSGIADMPLPKRVPFGNISG